MPSARLDLLAPPGDPPPRMEPSPPPQVERQTDPPELGEPRPPARAPAPSDPSTPAQDDPAQDDPGRAVEAQQARHPVEPSPSPSPARPPPRRRGPARSPFWAAVRSHVWLGVIVIAVAGTAAAGYWAARVHQRIDRASLEHGVGRREAAPAIQCVELQGNGAVWACGLVYRAQSVCLIANVNVVGDWNTNPGGDVCNRAPELIRMVPAPIRPADVAADLGRQLGAPWKCAKLEQHKVRWACDRPASVNQCFLIRIVPWAWSEMPSTVCAHVPALRHSKRAAKA